jgi:hypothetical protein
MFGGALEVKDGGEILVKTDNGLSPLSVDLGTVKITDAGSAIKSIEGLTVGKDAAVNLDFENAEITENSVVKGTLRVGQNATFNANLTVDGGTLELLEGATDIHLRDVKFGSTLNTMNDKIAKITANSWTLNEPLLNVPEDVEYVGGDGAMLWLLDFDLTTEKSDQLEIGTFNNAGDMPITIAGYNVLGNAEKDRYVFPVLNITGDKKNYPEIKITNSIYKASNGSLYELSARERDGKVLMSIIGASYPRDISEIYLPTDLLHQVALLSLSNLLDAVYDGRDDVSNEEEYHIWNKSLAYKYKFGVTGNGNINSRGKATLCGADSKPVTFENGGAWIATIFAGCLRENNNCTIANLNYTQDGHGNCSMFGVKSSWISENYGNASMICSYASIRTGNPDCVLRSHVFSVSSRYILSLSLAENVSLIPLLQVDFARVASPNTQVKDIQVNQEDGNTLRIAAGAHLQFGDDALKTSLGVKFSKNFRKEGSKSFNSINNIKSPHEISASYVECNAKVSGKINDNVNIDLAIGKSCGGRRGFSANLTLAATL